MLELRNIEVYYGLINAIRGVSFTIEAGSVTTILGPNGAGKTTVLNTIMGLLDDQPEKGTILFQNQPIEKLETEQIVRLGISYVPEGREVFNKLSVKENLIMGAYIRKERTAIEKDLDRIYDYFPVLKERSTQWAGTLSGGEQQMLAIGRALMNKPRLLLLDEPSLGLSPLLVKEIFKIIDSINSEGVTILLIEQNARMALKLADYGYILENGRFVASGGSQSLMDNEDVQEFYLGIQNESSIKGQKRYKRKKRWA